MKVRFVDLKRQNLVHETLYKKIFDDVAKSADFILGSDLARFEKDFASYIGKKYCVGVNSGTDGIKLTLLAYGIGEMDEVITVPNTYFSAASVIKEIGATAVFVDIDPLERLMNIKLVESVITKKTKAVIATHLYGNPLEMDLLIKLAKKYRLAIIEDVCQASGAKLKGRKLPITDTGVFSFYPGKNLGAFGDGGAVVTNNKNVYQKLLLLRNDGSKFKYHHEVWGYKSRLDSLQAAILSYKLKYLDSWNLTRREIASIYVKHLENISEITLPSEHELNASVFHLFVIETKKRDALKAHLESKGVETSIHYPVPIHLQKPFLKIGYKKGMFPVTESKSRLILSLPIFPEMTDEEIMHVCNNIKGFFAS